MEEIGSHDILLRESGSLIIRGDHKDYSIDGKLKEEFFGPLLIQCHGDHEATVAVSIINTEGCVFEKIRIRHSYGTALLLEDNWNLVMDKVRLMECAINTFCGRPAFICRSDKGKVSNDIILDKFTVEGGPTQAAQISNTELLDMTTVKLHGTRRDKYPHYHGPLMTAHRSSITMSKIRIAHASSEFGILQFHDKCRGSISQIHLQNNNTGPATFIDQKSDVVVK
jgi:hypothetical protein